MEAQTATVAIANRTQYTRQENDADGEGMCREIREIIDPPPIRVNGLDNRDVHSRLVFQFAKHVFAHLLDNPPIHLPRRNHSAGEVHRFSHAGSGGDMALAPAVCMGDPNNADYR